MVARIPFTFKMSEGGHRVVGIIMARVKDAGFEEPNKSQVARVIFHEVLNSATLRDRIVAKLCAEQKDRDA